MASDSDPAGRTVPSVARSVVTLMSLTLTRHVIEYRNNKEVRAGSSFRGIFRHDLGRRKRVGRSPSNDLFDNLDGDEACLEGQAEWVCQCKSEPMM